MPKVGCETLSGTTNYLYDGMGTRANIIEEVDDLANVQARYAQTLAIDQPLAEFRSGTTSFYEQDALSSVSSLSNSAGVLANTYTYDSFGEALTSSGTLVNDMPGAPSLRSLQGWEPRTCKPGTKMWGQKMWGRHGTFTRFSLRL